MSDRPSATPSYTSDNLASVIAGTAGEAVIKTVFNAVVAKCEIDVLERLRTEGPFDIQKRAERRMKIPAIAKLRMGASSGAQELVLPSFDSFTGKFNVSIFKKAVKSFYRKTRTLPYDALYRVYFIEREFSIFPHCFEAGFQAFLLNKFNAALDDYCLKYTASTTATAEETCSLSLLKKIFAYYSKLYSLPGEKIYCSDPSTPTPLTKEQRRARGQNLLDLKNPLAQHQYKYPNELLLEKIPKRALILLLDESFCRSGISFLDAAITMNPVKTLVLFGVLHEPANEAEHPRANLSIFDIRIRDSLVDYVADKMNFRTEYPYHKLSEWWLNERIAMLAKEDLTKNLISSGYFDVDTVFILNFMTSKESISAGNTIDVITTRFAPVAKQLIAALSNPLILMDRTLYPGSKKDSAQVFKTLLSTMTEMLRMFLEYAVSDELRIERKAILSKQELSSLEPSDVYTAVSTDTFLSSLITQTKGSCNIHTVFALYALSRQLVILLKAQGRECPKSIAQVSIQQYIEKTHILTNKDAHIRSSLLVSLVKYVEALASLARLARNCKDLHCVFVAEMREMVEYVKTLLGKFLKDKDALGKAFGFLSSRFENDESVYSLFYVAQLHEVLPKLCPSKVTDEFFSIVLRVYLRYGADGSMELSESYAVLCSLSSQWQAKLKEVSDPHYNYKPVRYPTSCQFTASYPVHIDQLTHESVAHEISQTFSSKELSSVLPMTASDYIAPPIEPSKYYVGFGYIYNRPSCRIETPVPLAADTHMLLFSVPLRAEPRDPSKKSLPPSLSDATKHTLQALCHLLYDSRFASMKKSLEHIIKHREVLSSGGKNGSPMAEELFLCVHSLSEYVTHLLGTLSRTSIYEKDSVLSRNKDLKEEHAVSLAGYASSVVTNYSTRSLKELQGLFERCMVAFFETTLSSKDTELLLLRPLRAFLPWNDVKVSLQRKCDQLLKAKDPYFAESRQDVLMKFSLKAAEEYYKTLLPLPLPHKNLTSQIKLKTINAVIVFAVSRFLTEDELPTVKGKLTNTHRETLLTYLNYATLHHTKSNLASVISRGYEAFLNNVHANRQIEKTWVSLVNTVSLNLDDFLGARGSMIAYGHREYVEQLCRVRTPKGFVSDCMHIFYKACCLMINDRNLDVVTQVSDDAKKYLHSFDPERPQVKSALQKPEFNNLFGWIVLLSECIFSYSVLDAAILNSSELGFLCTKMDDLEKILTTVRSFEGADAASCNLKVFISSLRSVASNTKIALAHRSGLIMLSIAVIVAVYLAPVPAESSNTDLKPKPPTPLHLARGPIRVYSGALGGVGHAPMVRSRMLARSEAQSDGLMLCAAPAAPMAFAATNFMVRSKAVPEPETKRKKLIRGGRGRQKIFKHTNYLISIVSRFYRAVSMELAATAAALLISGSANSFVSPLISILKDSVLSKADADSVIAALKAVTTKSFSVSSMSMIVRIVTLPVLLQHPSVRAFLSEVVMFSHFDVDLLLIRCCIMQFNTDGSMEIIKDYITRIVKRYQDACAQPNKTKGAVKQSGDAGGEFADSGIVSLPSNVESALNYMAIIPTMLNPEVRANSADGCSGNLDILPKNDIEKYPLMVTQDSRRNAFIDPARIRDLLVLTEFLADLPNPFKTGQVAEIQMAWFTNAVAHKYFEKRVMDMAYSFIDNYSGENLSYLIPGTQAKDAEFDYLRTKISVIEEASILCIASLVQSGDKEKEDFAIKKFENSIRLLVAAAHECTDLYINSCISIYLDLLHRMIGRRDLARAKCCDNCKKGRSSYKECALYKDICFIVRALESATKYSTTLTDYESFRVLKASLPLSELDGITELAELIIKNHEAPNETSCLCAVAAEIAKFTTMAIFMGNDLYINKAHMSVYDAIVKSDAPLLTRGVFSVALDLQDTTKEIVAKMGPEERQKFFSHPH